MGIVDSLASSDGVIRAVSEPKVSDLSENDARVNSALIAESEPRAEESREKLDIAVREVATAASANSQIKSLSFRVEEELSRIVVAVREVGSDVVIRQFPPEEFITVAKHIATQAPDMIDEDYLKGVLFDQYS